ncbi:hypothetical protein [Arenimonas oryziterrae]|uniref:Uncharacterized protein n=1 Tax=Arenimonas oryziterrae DSM 21050 = YC6267 TaxID=1121015 RepID=A0A091AT40_9GAMM|nr:hypothetical protein [Arenimonas oryziterrae]KFN43363.1 hypothetical protein N789_08800 [Arenimonas oryziterrae DSM 21050 = YC6267]
MPRWLILALGLAVGALCLFAWATRPSAPATVATALPAAGGGGQSPVGCALPPAFTDPNQPLQSPVDGRMSPFRFGPATITPLAGISLQARVLSREDYAFGTEADYSPTDLALGWGPMANPAASDRLDISQGGRWYRYRWGPEGPPIPVGDIVRSSANMHMIPADDAVANALGQVRAGNTVRVNGWLVRIDRDDGWHWQSSLTREDSGGGACELIYVCSISGY